MNSFTIKTYLKERAKGFSPAAAKDHVRTIATWEALEQSEMVRLQVLPDESPDLSFLGRYSDRWQRGAVDRQAAGDWERNQYRYFIPARPENAREDYKQMQRAERDGTWGIVGEYQHSDGSWEHVDSCWGFIGSDWQGSGYDLDIQRATISALVAALKDRCQNCGRY